MVSNEDREAAIALAADAIAGFPDEAKHFIDDATEAVDALVSHGWGPTRQIQIDTLLAARDAAREARRLCWADGRDEHTIRHWGGTAGWLASRAKKIEAGEEPDWPDAASSTRADDEIVLPFEVTE